MTYRDYLYAMHELARHYGVEDIEPFEYLAIQIAYKSAERPIPRVLAKRLGWTPDTSAAGAGHGQ